MTKLNTNTLPTFELDLHQHDQTSVLVPPSREALLTTASVLEKKNSSSKDTKMDYQEIIENFGHTKNLKIVGIVPFLVMNSVSRT